MLLWSVHLDPVLHITFRLLWLVCEQAGRLLGLSHVLVKYLQRHQTQQTAVPAPIKVEDAKPIAAPPRKWYSKLMRHGSRHKYKPVRRFQDHLATLPTLKPDKMHYNGQHI